jgi:hypothetical protein
MRALIRLRDINRVKLIVALVTGSVFAGLTFYMLNYDPGFSGPGLIFMMPGLYIAQFTSSRFLETLGRLGSTHRRTAYHHPEGNSYIERFHRSLKEEEVWTAKYQSHVVTSK